MSRGGYERPTNNSAYEPWSFPWNLRDRGPRSAAAFRVWQNP